MLEKFGWSGLWKHAGTSYIAAALIVADATLSYLSVIQLPSWAHALVAVAVIVLGAYKGQAKPAELKSAA